MAADRGVYQRANRIMSVGSSPAITAKGERIAVQCLFEKGDDALREDLAATAHFERYDARAKDYVTCDPPKDIAKTLKQRIGRFRLPILTGLVNAPTLRHDGSILAKPGYDLHTGLLFDPLGVEFPVMPDRPSKADAEAALALLRDLLKDFNFVEEANRAVALSAILTATVRRSLTTSPLHAFTAPVAGSGKSKLVDIASMIASGSEAGVTAHGKNDEELEKRLASQLLAGNSVIAVDNCEMPLGGEMLCQILTQTLVRPRILGKSKTPDLPTNTFVTATGNNLALKDDLTRRAILCSLDPKVERPEMRIFDREPVKTARDHRVHYVIAALTILRAFHVAGRPNKPVALGSFEDWSDLVRGALMWLGCADPVSTMDKVRSRDPALEGLISVITQWQRAIGNDCVTVPEAIKRAEEMFNGDYVSPEFRDALLNVAGQRGEIKSRPLGKWLSSHQDRIVAGHRIEHHGTKQGIAIWAIRRME